MDRKKTIRGTLTHRFTHSHFLCLPMIYSLCWANFAVARAAVALAAVAPLDSTLNPEQLFFAALGKTPGVVPLGVLDLANLANLADGQSSALRLFAFEVTATPQDLTRSLKDKLRQTHDIELFEIGPQTTATATSGGQQQPHTASLLVLEKGVGEEIKDPYQRLLQRLGKSSVLSLTPFTDGSWIGHWSPSDKLLSMLMRAQTDPTTAPPFAQRNVLGLRAKELTFATVTIEDTAQTMGQWEMPTGPRELISLIKTINGIQVKEVQRFDEKVHMSLQDSSGSVNLDVMVRGLPDGQNSILSVVSLTSKEN